VKGVERFIEWLILVAVLAAGCWYGAPAVFSRGWSAVQAGEAAKVTAHAQAGALAADTTAANRAQASCTAEIARTQRADAAIAKAAQPVVAQAGQPQPLITEAQINAMLGVQP
jgi:hypothetical protein